MSDIAVQMGQRIRELRTDRQMNQEELAFKAGISPAHLGQIERATKNPTIDTISRIASALSVPITELFSDDTAPVTSPNATIEKMKHQYIKYNPADLATKPSKVHYQANEPYSIEEVAQLLTVTKDEPIAVPIFLACFYGLRRSEALGLRWSNIDFQSGWLHIVTTVVKEKIGDNIVSTVRDDTTKTEYSRRSLPLCPYTYQYFCALRSQQLMQMQLCGSSYNRDYLDFVCVDNLGMLLQPDFVSQKFQKLLEKYALRPIRFHDLRHSCATILLYLGYTMKDIQMWLGHSNYSFTANTYVHSSKDSHIQMAQSFSEKLPVLDAGFMDESPQLPALSSYIE